ncbi:hypothetical protein EDD15DRAFT_2362285 [Pisolithus albus]|nr:hypothetical protein EDD15DRAFT_2362285 [Pisolithus albus]
MYTVEKGLPVYSIDQRDQRMPWHPWLNLKALVFPLLVFVALGFSLYPSFPLATDGNSHTDWAPFISTDILARCSALDMSPGPPPEFYSRSVSDRYEPGTSAVLIRNATIWTGSAGGNEVVAGDILLDHGLIQLIGTQLDVPDDALLIDAQGAWVTPGIVDVHSHHGVMSSPLLSGADDANSPKEITEPWLRSLDGLNTHDDAYNLSIAGGVTTSLVLPGSGNAIGGQAFTIKLRVTKERSSSSMLVAPPYGLNGSTIDYSIPPLWRHMKHACGENPSKSFGGVRMDTVWAYRTLYDKGRQLKEKQDDYCAKVLNGTATEELGPFPDDLQYEAVVDTLRGKVKVHVHCYEAVDLDAFVRLTNEFKFPVAAFHHAHEAYLVPELLKKAYNHTPAIAMFGSFARFKREGYRHSTYAPRILHDAGVDVIMKASIGLFFAKHSTDSVFQFYQSDTPAAVASRWLLHDAQQAYYYGLPENAAIASVTTTAANLLGLDYRLGYIKEGYDADLVIWDSHPLALGTTPLQVFIDGIPQLTNPVSVRKESFQEAAITPDFDDEAQATVTYEGLPPLDPKEAVTTIVFRNASSIWLRDSSGAKLVYEAPAAEYEGVLVFDGTIVCVGSEDECPPDNYAGYYVKDLQRGSIMPALTSVGTALGLQEIPLERTTSDGPVNDPLLGSMPGILDDGIVSAYDGLMFRTRDALLAYRAGVTSSITAPITPASGDNLNVGFLQGISTFLSLGAKHKLEKGAVVKRDAALHVGILHRGTGVSVSTQIATLRNLLLNHDDSRRGKMFEAVYNGTLTLAVDAKNADIIASLVALKAEVEAQSNVPMKMTIVGGAEAHLLAPELASANVGVIIAPVRSFPFYWEGRRALPGPPLTRDNVLTTLIKNNVTVGIGHQGVEEVVMLTGWAAQNMRWDAAWASIDAPDVIDTATALNMASTNVELLLGVDRDSDAVDLVATTGGDLLSFEGKVAAVISQDRSVVDIF